MAPISSSSYPALHPQVIQHTAFDTYAAKGALVFVDNDVVRQAFQHVYSHLVSSGSIWEGGNFLSRVHSLYSRFRHAYLVSGVRCQKIQEFRNSEFKIDFVRSVNSSIPQFLNALIVF
jgi:hypothetical protein